MKRDCRRESRTISGLLPLAVAGLACVVLAHHAGAREYPIQVNPTLNGLNVVIDPVIAGRLVIIKLTNKADRVARCELEFLNGPQFPFRRVTRIEPGKTEPIPFSPDREVTSLTVNVDCAPEGT